MAYCLCRRRQTASTGLRDHFRLLAGRVLVGALNAAKAAVFRGSPAAAGRDHNLLAEAIQDPFCCLVSSRTGSRSAGRCMRLAGADCRILLLLLLHHLLLRRAHHLHRSDRLGACRISGWEQVEEACCSRAAQSLCAVDARLQKRFATSWRQPELGQFRIRCTVALTKDTHLFRLGVHGQPVGVEALVVCHLVTGTLWILRCQRQGVCKAAG